MASGRCADRRRRADGRPARGSGRARRRPDPPGRSVRRVKVGPNVSPRSSRLVRGRHRPGDRGLMRAVNLLPRDARTRGLGRPPRSSVRRRRRSRGRDRLRWLSRNAGVGADVGSALAAGLGRGGARPASPDDEQLPRRTARRRGSSRRSNGSRRGARGGALDARARRQASSGSWRYVLPADVWLTGLTATVPAERAHGRRRGDARRHDRGDGARSRERRTRRPPSPGSSRDSRTLCRRSRACGSRRASRVEPQADDAGSGANEEGRRRSVGPS